MKYVTKYIISSRIISFLNMICLNPMGGESSEEAGDNQEQTETRRQEQGGRIRSLCVSDEGEGPKPKPQTLHLNPKP